MGRRKRCTESQARSISKRCTRATIDPKQYNLKLFDAFSKESKYTLEGPEGLFKQFILLSGRDIRDSSEAFAPGRRRHLSQIYPSTCVPEFRREKDHVRAMLA